MEPPAPRSSGRRTSLQTLAVSQRVRALVVTSSLPGEGKTTTAINLAITMAEAGSRVLLVDADLRRPAVSRYLGLEGSVGLTTVLIGEAEVEDVTQVWGSERLHVLSAGHIPSDPSEPARLGGDGRAWSPPSASATTS
ncbi:hypothetical protein GCM10025868_14560 [Angustibacter aerolatus]|uniref:CobQ/CobB/MinD/ParA nucleotide binding domain-containing protein n=1 Tax=Angustibacter aerolatus TaxID=1162965 RepID=A0ABQ6JF53_9ACTN|nr:hypothetical protein GCM10025868_14560 [Angustibacter aerolatus]